MLREDTASATTEVTLQRVQPVQSLYRRGRGFAFERREILGATPSELLATYGADFELDEASPNAALLVVDAGDYALARTRCTIAFQDGRAVALQIVVDHSGRADFGPLALEALRGAARAGARHRARRRRQHVALRRRRRCAAARRLVAAGGEREPTVEDCGP